MSYKTFVLSAFILAIPSSSLPMDPPMPPPLDRQYPISMRPMAFPGDYEDKEIIPRPLQLNNSNSDTFENMRVHDLKYVLERDTERSVDFIIHCIKSEQSYYRGHTYQFLVGKAGTGKTVFAKAIAHQICTELPEWSYEYISSRAFMGKYRNETGVALREYLKKIVTLNKPYILIIDQINKILEHPQSSSDDTAMTSSVLTAFMDEQECNKNLFFIGIMDRATEICKRLKSRLLASTTWIEEPTDTETQRIIFTSKLVNEYTQLHSEVTNEWLMHYLEQAPTIKGRHYRELALQVHKLLKEENSPKPISLITKQHLTAALEAYETVKKSDEDNIEYYESNWDKTERHHQERLRQMQRLHQQNMAHTWALHEQRMAQQHEQHLARMALINAQNQNNGAENFPWCATQ